MMKKELITLLGIFVLFSTAFANPDDDRESRARRCKMIESQEMKRLVKRYSLSEEDQRELRVIVADYAIKRAESDALSGGLQQASDSLSKQTNGRIRLYLMQKRGIGLKEDFRLAIFNASRLNLTEEQKSVIVEKSQFERSQVGKEGFSRRSFQLGVLKEVLTDEQKDRFAAIQYEEEEKQRIGEEPSVGAAPSKKSRSATINSAQVSSNRNREAEIKKRRVRIDYAGDNQRIKDESMKIDMRHSGIPTRPHVDLILKNRALFRLSDDQLNQLIDGTAQSYIPAQKRGVSITQVEHELIRKVLTPEQMSRYIGLTHKSQLEAKAIEKFNERLVMGRVKAEDSTKWLSKLFDLELKKEMVKRVYSNDSIARRRELAKLDMVYHSETSFKNIAIALNRRTTFKLSKAQVDTLINWAATHQGRFTRIEDNWTQERTMLKEQLSDEQFVKVLEVRNHERAQADTRKSWTNLKAYQKDAGMDSLSFARSVYPYYRSLRVNREYYADQPQALEEREEYLKRNAMPPVLKVLQKERSKAKKAAKKGKPTVSTNQLIW